MRTLDDLPEGVLAAIRAHVAAAYPREGCGVVLEEGDGVVAVACRNVAADPARHFAVGWRERRALGRRVQAGARLVAIYHGHVDEPAALSAADRHYAAAYPDVLHVVACVTAAGVLTLRGFRADGTPVGAPEAAAVPA